MQRTVGPLAVHLHADRRALGAAAAREAAAALQDAIAERGVARVIFASAPSQEELLAGLAGDASIDWARVTAFHMDEYVGLAAGHRAGFARFLTDRLPLERATFHALRSDARETTAECARYASLLAEAPIDLCCLGIGENGHLAFNEPGVADLDDPALVKEVELDRASREQQVHDGCFAELGDVPERALTLTLPALLGARRLVCVVPGPTKAQAVRAALEGPVTMACPASALRTHAHASLHIDRASASLLSS